ncbi:DUF1328 domain-containing protein [Zunongwangia sp. F363]|uniref:DUF1328 domain-containing protein n=1 Tax=Autumnicola tepida TaxID=3075595 RepID=A0ABU3CDM6_9FLAO|nr:DUF1328 domain-containing protein [Zunongwangia sp. F363]MDT0644451.1 DUF1328 domain-containing protein [Zunongwangia sp. F363]
MKKILIYLVIAVITGIIGFSGISFDGIELVRIAFLIFADLLIVSLLASVFFSAQPTQNLKLKRIRNR